MATDSPNVITQTTRSGVMYLNRGGRPSPGWPKRSTMESLPSGAAPIAVDVRGLGTPDVVSLNGSGMLTSFNAQGAMPPGWPLGTGAGASGSPLVTDFASGDNAIEIVAPDHLGKLYAYEFPTATASQTANPWPMLGGDAGRSSVAAGRAHLERARAERGTAVKGTLVAYPNPARRSPVTFAFTLSEPSRVQFEILDTSGHSVASFTRDGTQADNIAVWEPGALPGRALPGARQVHAARCRITTRARSCWWGCCDDRATDARAVPHGVRARAGRAARWPPGWRAASSAAPRGSALALPLVTGTSRPELLLAQRTIDRSWGPSDDSTYHEVNVPGWKSEGGAMAFSFLIPGAGQMYAGEKSGVLFMIGEAIGIYEVFALLNSADEWDKKARTYAGNPYDSTSTWSFDSYQQRTGSSTADLQALYAADPSLFYYRIGEDPSLAPGWVDYSGGLESRSTFTTYRRRCRGAAQALAHVALGAVDQSPGLGDRCASAWRGSRTCRCATICTCT